MRKKLALVGSIFQIERTTCKKGSFCVEKTVVLKHLQTYIDKKKTEQAALKSPDKKVMRQLAVLESLNEGFISFGECPRYFGAYLACNSTGVGESSFEGTKTQRTVSRDYVTDECLFIDGHEGAGVKGLQIFVLKEGQTITYYLKENAIKLAKSFGYQLHLQYFHDLNFSLTDHRLNRHTLHVTRQPFSYPVRPILAANPKTGHTFTVGYVYEKDGKEYIIIEPDELAKMGESDKKSGCAPWMILGLFCPPLLIIGLIVRAMGAWIKSEKERMIG